MFKIIFLVFLFTYVNCESELDSVTTVLPNYSVNQVDDDSNSNIQQVEIKSSEIQGHAVNAVPSSAFNVPSVVQTEPVVVNSNEIPILSDEIQNNDVRIENEVPRANEVKQVHIDSKSTLEVEAETAAPEEITTTISPVVYRVKRAPPSYTVRELLAPNGVRHEV